MVTKKRRRTLNHKATSSTTTARVSLTSLPIEILAEILLYTCSPPTVLAVSRTCSFLYRSLALNPNASFIWRGVRKTCSPVPLPEPGDGWKMSEADYAALVFGGGVCEVCHKATRAMYASFSARIRLCGNWHCRAKLLDESLTNVTSETHGWLRQSFWVPPVESTRCFYPSRLGALIWPRGELLLRKSDWEAFQRDAKAYEQALAECEQAVALTGLPLPAGQEDEQGERIVKRCRAAKERLPQVMEFSVRLVQWKWDYDQEFKIVKKHNRTWTKNLAESEGWNLEDLVESQTYESLQRRKTFLLEKIEEKDVSPIRTVIESELLALQARHKRQEAEASYRGKLTEVKKIYERMRCGTLEVAHTGSSGSSDPLILPPLSVFCTLPSVRALKGSPDPNVLPPSSTSDTNDINSNLAISLVKADIHTWLTPVQKHLMALLGYPNGWQSASTRTLHPLKRVTARFFCRRCGEGKVGRAYQREQCLDFKGVCSHVCMTAPRKSVEDGNGQEKGGSKGKMLDWKVDMFEKNEKVIRVIKTILNHIGMSEDTATVSAVMKATGGSIQCMSCKGWIIGHARRHESMEIRVLPASAATLDEVWRMMLRRQPFADMYRPLISSRPAFERGNCELLLGPSYQGRSLCKKVNYGCKHCLVEEDDGMAGIEKPESIKEARLMDFNGLRSHVKGKHGIQEIRDEDFFCYTSIKDGRKG
ncbi:hypothetical protein L210DRAFT_3761635 [Boletus edulis BED1]|uniref:F-box domain-containing protein n=1 Tax=Boletus edulis BED1 TaxID=1328754 RepID=A0AAD4BRI3_BOLED|nr:hypothetical protein L210DRAFT_3761635 [Boletus edulis BED1]